MYRWFLAQRYLLSRPINLLGTAGVVVSVWALIVVVSIFSGFLVEVRNHVRAASSDLTVLGCERLEQVEWALRDENVAAYAPRVVSYGLLHSLDRTHRVLPSVQALAEPGEESPLVRLVGIEPALEAQVTDFDRWVRGVADPALGVADPAAPLATRGEAPAILLSERRLRSQRIAPGHVLDLTSAQVAADASGVNVELLETQFAVAGAYATRHTAFDNQTAFVHIDALRALMGEGHDDAVTEIVVRCRDPELAAATAARLERVIRREQPQILVRTWEELNGQFLSAVDHQRALMKLVLTVILVVAAFLMYATLSMMVTEKTHDIGILTAMGATRGGVLRIFLFCGMAIAAVGAAVGVVAGCLSSFYLDAFNTWLRASFDIDLFPTRIYNLDRVPYDLDPAWIAQVSVMALGVGLLVSGLPAWRAARHNPVESLRNE
jgi:lipoprotein-releasing system permease protein